MNISKNKFIAEHLALTLQFEVKTQALFASALNKTYRLAGQAYKASGVEGMKAVLNSHREEVYYLVASSYQKVIPAYGKLILGQIKGVTPNFETKSHITSNAENFFIELSTKWILDQGLKEANQISGSTLDDINNIINNGIIEGLGIPDITKNILDSADDMSRFRARMIAITEVHNASMFASVETANATGLQLQKEWAAVEDARTRETHRQADGQTVDMNERFTVGGYRMDRPGDPSAPAEEVINCRCTLLYHEKTIDISNE